VTLLSIIEKWSTSEANPRDHTSNEPMAFSHGSERQHGFPAHEAKVARVCGNANATNPLEKSVEQGSRGLLEKRLAVSAPSLAIDNVIALPGPLQHGGNDFRGILKVGIDDANKLAVGPIQTSGQRGLMTEITAEVDHLDKVVPARCLLEKACGAVARSVVDEYEFDNPRGKFFAHEAESP
jgi:hypothetical protein